MNETQKFLTNRKSQLEAMIKAATAPLQAELEQVIAALNAMPKVGATNTAQTKQPYLTVANHSAKTVPQQIMAIIESHPQGILSKDITESVNTIYGRTLSRGNTSAYLSNLKKDGLANFDDNGLWRKVDKKEAPEKEASIFD